MSEGRGDVTMRRPVSGRPASVSIPARDTEKLRTLLTTQREQAERRSHRAVKVVSIYEAGRDGFWLHRWLLAQAVESHVVDPASILGPQRRRKAKTDRIDGEALVRTLLAYKRGEPRVCAMVRVPTPEKEDRRRKRCCTDQRTGRSNPNPSDLI
jgi:transposase